MQRMEDVRQDCDLKPMQFLLINIAPVNLTIKKVVFNVVTTTTKQQQNETKVERKAATEMAGKS